MDLKSALEQKKRELEKDKQELAKVEAEIAELQAEAEKIKERIATHEQEMKKAQDDLTAELAKLAEGKEEEK